MANNRFFQNEEEQVISIIHDKAISKITEVLLDQDAAHLARTCKMLYRRTYLAHQAKFKKRMQEFLQAVINDDRKTVENLLDRYPKLLLATPPSDLVIESQCTWQKFKAEAALTMAVKQKQIKMAQLLLSYCDKLPQTPDVISAKTTGLATWKPYETQTTANGEDEIIVPREYDLLAESLVAVFREETFPNGIPGEIVPLNIELSASTESALLSLLNLLVPKNAVKLDDCVDGELLLLAIYKSYVKNFSSFDDWAKLDALSIRLMGLIQSTLISESGKMICEGLDIVVPAMEKGEEVEISPRAAACKLKSGEELYRENRDVRQGCGFHFFCGVRLGMSSTRAGTDPHSAPVRYYEKTMSNKNKLFAEYYAAIAAARPSRCSK